MAERAVIFDLDGTLVDSADDIGAALAIAMADHGFTAPTRANVRAWVGGGARSLIERALAGHPELVDPVLARFRVHYATTPVLHTQLYAGIADVLDHLAATHAIAILSNKPHTLVVPIVERLLGGWAFHPILGHRPGTPLKPDPAAALEIATALELAPSQCTLIGDAPSDVATANAAGMAAIAVSWGYRPREELLATGARVVDAPSELAKLVDGVSAETR